jgi:hypothetical protein
MLSVSRVALAVALALSSALLSACSSDAASEPEPPLETPGAFVAVDEGTGALTLHRTLTTIVVENVDTFIFLTVYDVNPSTWEAAREISKRHDLPVREEVQAPPRKLFPAGPHRVVWFRSLTQEEEERVK